VIVLIALIVLGTFLLMFFFRFFMPLFGRR